MDRKMVATDKWQSDSGKDNMTRNIHFQCVKPPQTILYTMYIPYDDVNAAHVATFAHASFP